MCRAFVPMCVTSMRCLFVNPHLHIRCSRKTVVIILENFHHQPMIWCVTRVNCKANLWNLPAPLLAPSRTQHCHSWLLHTHSDFVNCIST